jgi:alkylhydroperoxidase family enzyme
MVKVAAVRWSLFRGQLDAQVFALLPWVSASLATVVVARCLCCILCMICHMAQLQCLLFCGYTFNRCSAFSSTPMLSVGVEEQALQLRKAEEVSELLSRLQSAPVQLQVRLYEASEHRLR